jgi:inorganic pyrophosphatase/exopolyphosphatase
MNSLDLEKALQRYTDALTKLEALTATKRKQNDENATEIVLDVLVIRDRIQSLLTQTSHNPKKILLTLSELDQRLKQKADVIVQIAPLAQWRDILNPPKTAWWWFFDTLEYVHAWDRYD